MEHMRPYFDRYDRILVFDTETTGLSVAGDEIIQFSAAVLAMVDGVPAVTQQYDRLIQLSPGKRLPPEITNLTGITEEAIAQRGISKEQACREISELLSGNTLLAAYNAQFDLSFLFYLLYRHGDVEILKNKDKLDLLTVYRDRRSYPHKLFAAIEAYGLSDKVRNSHSADEDALAAAYVMDAMAAERDDLMCYLNIFGYIPKYGPPKPKIRSVTYLPQRYDPDAPVYVQMV